MDEIRSSCLCLAVTTAAIVMGMRDENQAQNFCCNYRSLFDQIHSPHPLQSNSVFPADCTAWKLVRYVPYVRCVPFVRWQYPLYTDRP